MGQINFDIAIEAFGDAAFIRSAIFRGDGSANRSTSGRESS